MPDPFRHGLTMRRASAAARRATCRAIRGRAARCGAWAPAGLTLALAVKGCWPALPGIPCPLRALTGIPCPTCFLTRATAAALTGQLEHSVRLHAFGPLVAALLLAWSVAAIHSGRAVPVRPSARAVILVGVALLVYWLGRLILQFGFDLPVFAA